MSHYTEEHLLQYSETPHLFALKACPVSAIYLFPACWTLVEKLFNTALKVA